MSRLTGTDAYGLMEAYNAVYAPQELTEEQVWEEVETWVNSLLEEGYDLSDYTWEEMYESYLNEFSGNLIGDLKANAGNIARGVSGAYQGAMRTASNVNKSISDRMQRNIKPITTPKPPSRTFQSDSGGSTGFGRYAEPTQFITPTPARTPAPTPRTPPRVTPGVTPVPITRTPAPRSTTPPARPATPPGGTTKPTAPVTTTPTPASAPRPKDTSITDMIGRSQVRQGAAVNTGSSTSDARAIAARSSVGATPKPAVSTPARRMGGGRERMLSQSFDVFDVIKGHLIDEGYADTEESALVIMANMSEEWKQSIVEDFPNVLNFPSQGGSRSGDAGTRGLKMIQTPGGQRGYINKHSGGEILPSGTVNKIMGGNLMVKNGTKKNTNSNIA